MNTGEDKAVRCVPDLDWRVLSRRYTRVFWLYVAVVMVLFVLRVEASAGHVTPFYAMFSPVFPALSLPLGLVAAGWLAWRLTRDRLPGAPRLTPLRRAISVVPPLLVALFALAVLPGELRALGPSGYVVANLAALRWHVLAVAVFVLFMGGGLAFLRRAGWPGRELSRRATAGLLAGLVVFSFSFSGAVAMLRGGPAGISRAYERTALEYPGDIGKGGTIRGLFGNYTALHPELSLHAKVHPPGPVALLWAMSWVVGRGALALSLATMAFGALAVMPLYGWARDLAGPRIALTCCVLYTLMPSVVLFTATSADILFMPLVLTTLFLFDRALRRGSVAWAVAAGVFYAMLALCSFTLVSLGAYFALAGLWQFGRTRRAGGVAKTALAMAASCAGLLAAVWVWSGFDIVECFFICLNQFRLDQHYLDLHEPRYPSWAWTFLNPACWFFYAGVPVSVLFTHRLLRPEPETRVLFFLFGATLAALSMLYLARGEGERSAMYVLPFAVLPAAHLLGQARSTAPLAATAVFLALQTWAMESLLDTHW